MINKVKKKVRNSLLKSIVKYVHLKNASREISEFLNLPKLSFEVTIGEPRKITDHFMKYKGKDGVERCVYTPKSFLSATFHTEKNRNIITLYPDPISKKLTGILKDNTHTFGHEVFHGYHVNNNESLIKCISELEEFYSVIDLSIDKMDELIPYKERAYLSGASDILCFKALTCETLVRAYEKARNGLAELKTKTEVSLERFRKDLEKEELINFNFNFKGNYIFWRDIFSLMNCQYKKAYDLSEIADSLLLADHLKEPKISFSIQNGEKERKLSIEAAYFSISAEKAKDVINEGIREDYWKFSKKVIEKYKQHIERIRNASKFF